MGFLISQIVVSLLLAAAAGFLIGYFLKQFLAGKASEQLERMWSEKVRTVSRDLDALRTDARAQTQKTGDIERIADAERDRGKSAQSEAAAERDRAESLTARIALKQKEIESLQGAVAEWKANVESLKTQIGGLEEVIRGRDLTIENLTSEIERAGKESAAKDLGMQTLAVRIAELEPAASKAMASMKTIENWEAKYKALEAAKNGELASLKSRISALEPLLAKVRDWEARYNGMLKEKDSSTAELRQTAIQDGENIRQLYATAVQQGDNIRSLAAPIGELARITETHGDRIAGLEGGR